MVKRTATSRLVAALALAFVLITQSVVGAFALGADGARSQLDAFGNPLCLNGADHDNSSGSGTPDHSKIPSCCNFACSMFWPGLAAPTDVGQIVLGLRPADGLAFAQVSPIDLQEQGYRPGNPRAPPLTV